MSRVVLCLICWIALRIRRTLEAQTCFLFTCRTSTSCCWSFWLLLSSSASVHGHPVAHITRAAARLAASTRAVTPIVPTLYARRQSSTSSLLCSCDPPSKCPRTLGCFPASFPAALQSDSKFCLFEVYTERSGPSIYQWIEEELHGTCQCWSSTRLQVNDNVIRLLSLPSVSQFYLRWDDRAQI